MAATSSSSSVSSPSLATGEWSLLMNRYYRKNDVYEMLWGDIDLDKFIIVGAPFGGPIGMMTHHHHITTITTIIISPSPNVNVITYYVMSDTAMVPDDRKAPSPKPRMRIFTSAGKLISEFTVSIKHTLLMITWTERKLND
jgi:hypothetical protein